MRPVSRGRLCPFLTTGATTAPRLITAVEEVWHPGTAFFHVLRGRGMSKAIRVAMWSGPRNISTALMRSWGQRADTFVCDEPLYAHYLLSTGTDHPGVDEVVARHETDWRTVVAGLTGGIPDGKAVFYQKHMAHHLLPEIDRHWLKALANCFLIRHPREMLPSLAAKIPQPVLADTGLAQQVEIFRSCREQTGMIPPVVDARDVLSDPARLLRLLCERLEIEFEDAMLSWPPGPRSTDGVWSKYWYDAVEKSTSFGPYRPKTDPLPRALSSLHKECLPYYDELHKHRLGQ